MTYDYYRMFCYVAQYRSFTRAAEALGSNQPNVTRCMNNLEQELGCKLFVRSNRGITLTPEGERLYRHVSVACEQLRAGEEELRRDRSLEGGTVSVGASETALHLLLLEKLSAFHRRYPGVHLRITNHSTPQAGAALRSGLIDFAVVTTPSGVKAPLRETKLLTFREILIGGPGMCGPGEGKRRLEEMAQFPLVCLGEGTSTYAFYQRLFLKHGLPFRVDMEAATMDQVLPMVRHGLGVGFFSETLAAQAIAGGEVVKIPLEETIPPRAVSLIEDTTRPLSIAAKALKRTICGE